MILITRHKNGKFYCPELGGTLTLDQIFDTVKSGSKVEVVDGATKENITKETLIKCLHRNFIQNKDRIVLKDIEETIQTLDDSYDILSKVGE